MACSMPFHDSAIACYIKCFNSARGLITKIVNLKRGRLHIIFLGVFMNLVFENWQLGIIAGLVLVAKLFSGKLLDIVIRGIDHATLNDTSKPFRENQTYKKFSTATALMILYGGFTNYIDPQYEYFDVIDVLLSMALVLVITRLLFSFADVADSLYQYKPTANEIPISGFLQALKVILSIGAIVIIISLIIGQPPGYLLGSAAAVIGLIAIGIKDTILGFVNGFQVVANRLISVGDWLEAPAFKADGTVKRIGLNVITVQNWDKTLSIIPTHAVMNTPIKNWKGMSKSGVRKIQRHINIDQKSIKLLDPYKVEQLSEHFGCELDASETNMTLFRFWVKHYLQSNENISNMETLLVRTKQPTPEGLPLEIYCFCTNNAWVPYEEIQSAIIERIISNAKLFEIMIYQRVSDYSQ